MVGNLLELGLRIDLKKAMAGLPDLRFVALSLLWRSCCVRRSLMRWGVVLPLTEPYAMGRLLLGRAPCAPLLPGMVDKARGDVNYAASFMLLASAGTAIYMPDPVRCWSGPDRQRLDRRKPMLFLVMIPLGVGIVIQMRGRRRRRSCSLMSRSSRAVDTLLMLLVVVVMYAKDSPTPSALADPGRRCCSSR